MQPMRPLFKDTSSNQRHSSIPHIYIGKTTYEFKRVNATVIVPWDHLDRNHPYAYRQRRNHPSKQPITA